MKQKSHNLYQISTATLLDIKDRIRTAFNRETAEHPGKIDLMPIVSQVMKPVITINHFHDGEPRAYKAWPTICRNPIKDDIYYVFSPVGYDGSTYMPHQGVLLIGKKEHNINGLLFAGGHTDPEYIFMPNDEGTALPADYDQDTSIHSIVNAGIQRPDTTYIFFKSTNPADLNELLLTEYSRIRTFNLNGRALNLDLPTALAKENQIDKCLGGSITAPIIRNFGPVLALAYRCDNPHQPIDFCPEGFERISAAEYQWYAADEHDSLVGIKLPQAPSSLSSKFPNRETAHIDKVLACAPSAP